jgi:hypothetical protein
MHDRDPSFIIIIFWVWQMYFHILLKFVECRFKREVQLTEFSFPDV